MNDQFREQAERINERFGNRNGRMPLGGFVVGGVLTLLGVLMLLRNFGIIERDFWDYWPLGLVALGLYKIYEARGRSAGVMFGLIVTAIGSLMFLRTMDYLRFDADIFWPGIVICAGLVLLFRNLEHRKYLEGSAPRDLASEAEVSQVAIFGGTKRLVDTKDFRSGDFVAVFGGVELDLSKSVMATDEALIDATAVFGGIEIRVPTTWNVILKGSAIFGGYEDKTIHPALGQNENAPKLILAGFAIFGGVTIKN
jgi:predicted membrane protein